MIHGITAMRDTRLQASGTVCICPRRHTTLPCETTLQGVPKIKKSTRTIKTQIVSSKLGNHLQAAARIHAKALADSQESEQLGHVDS